MARVLLVANKTLGSGDRLARSAVDAPFDSCRHGIEFAAEPTVRTHRAELPGLTGADRLRAYWA